MIGLVLSAELDGVTNFTFGDSVNTPFDFIFRVACSNCHEEHDKPVSVNRYTKVDLAGSRGEANFTLRCRMCGKENNASFTGDLGSYNAEDSGSAKQMATLDCRGLIPLEFLTDGLQFKADGTGPKTSPKFNVELDGGEWYDYDDANAREVNILEAKWSFTKTK